MSDYHKILAEADEEARQDYTYEPLITEDENYNATPYEKNNLISSANEDTNVVIDISDTDVVAQPDMVEVKRNIIIDTAWRDWTIQPDAFSNVFSFGTQQPISYTSPQVPVFFNNPTIPFIAYETPLSSLVVGPGAGTLFDVNMVPNIQQQVFPVGVTAPSYLLRKPDIFKPTYGWKLVISNGTYLHAPQPFNYNDPNVKVLFYPTYDARETRGAQVSIDIQPKRYLRDEFSFSTQLAVSNVKEILLSRAILPVRSMQTYKPTIFTGDMIYPSALHFKPFLYMNIESIRGNYYGAGDVLQKSFSVLSQDGRNNYDGHTEYPSQFIDFKSWDQDSYTFDPPLSKLSNANITLFDSAGNQLSQLDNLNVVAMRLLTGADIGKVQFFISRSVQNTTFGNSNIFSGNEMRVGDNMYFYAPAVAQIAADSAVTSSMKAFLDLFQNNFIVTSICDSQADFSANYTFPIHNIGTSFIAVPWSQTIPQASNIYVTISTLISSVSQVCLQAYTNGPAFTSNRSFSQDYVMPMLNTDLQATFVLQITTLEPDTSKIKKIIPN